MLDISRCHSLAVTEFYSRYVSKSLPVVLSGLADNCQALRCWNFDFFSARYGDLMVKVSDGFGSHAMMLLSEFIARVQDDEFSGRYLRNLKIAAVDRQLFNDLPDLPHFSFDILRHLVSTKDFLKEIFIGAKNSCTPIHTDLWNSHSWMLLISGCKEWVLIDPEVATSSGFAKDIRKKEVRDNIDVYLEGIEHYRFVQNVGEYVYIPSRWWHSVVNTEASIGVSFNFIDPFSLPAGFATSQERALMFDELLGKSAVELCAPTRRDVPPELQEMIKAAYMEFLNFRLAGLELKRQELESVLQLLNERCAVPAAQSEKLKSGV